MESYGFKHVKGGWQGGRGWQVNGSAINDTTSGPYPYLLASKWMIENVFEALDNPNEWFYDVKEGKISPGESVIWTDNDSSGSKITVKSL